MTQADLTHQYVVDQLNLQVVDRLLVLNYGEDARGAVQVVPAPIVDAKRSFYRDLYKTLLANPNFQAHELSALDLDALKDTLGLPKSTEIDRLGKQPISPSLQNPGAIACGDSDDDEGHWVTIDGHPVKIKGSAPDRREETIRLLADTKYGGDRRKAREEYEKYVKDLAFLIKNPILGSNPGADNAKMTKFSDKLTQADLDKAEGDAQKFLASYLRGERADHPGQFRGNGVFSELSELRKMAESGAVMTPAQRTAYDDLNRWADAWYSCYQRAVHGMTKFEQLGGMIGKGGHHDLIGALGGFAGVGIGGKSIRPETGENVWARPQEAGEPTRKQGEGNPSADTGTQTPIWSSTPNKTAAENAAGHWNKHGAVFPQYKNVDEYIRGTQDFVNHPPSGTLIKHRQNGDTLFYDPATNTFAVRAANGTPRTMFKPNAGLGYWNQQ